MSRIKRILVPTDFSPTAEIALQYAIDLAPAGASIHVIHVVDDTGLLASYPDGMYVDRGGTACRPCHGSADAA